MFLTLVCISLVLKIASAKPHVYDKKACKQITEKRQDDPVLFESVKMGVFSEKAYFASCLFNMFTEQTQDKLLYLVGLYISADKYFGTDPRFAGEKVVKPDFFKKFPSPEVSDLDVHLKKACETNATACISAVYNHGAGKSGTIQQFLVSGYMRTT